MCALASSRSMLKYFNLKNKRTVFLHIFIFVIVTVLLLVSYMGDFYNVNTLRANYFKKFDTHDDIVQRYLEKRKKWNTSNLGSLLFKFHVTNDVIQNNTRNRDNKRFIVLIWKHWDWLKNRHVYNFNNKRTRKEDPLSDCSVKNCLITGDNKYLGSADAVVIHIQRGVFPSVSNRNRDQRWIFLSDESPINSFSMAKSKPKLSDLKNIFNWSMTYRSDADVPVPYGRTVPLSMPLLHDVSYKFLVQLVPYWNIKRRDKLAAILMSNCKVSKRMEYLNELEESDADVPVPYGRTVPLSMPLLHDVSYKFLVQLVPYWNIKRRDKLAAILMSNCKVSKRMEYLNELEEYLPLDIYGKCSTDHKNSCPGHFKSDCNVTTGYLFYLVFENSQCREYLTEKAFNNAYEKGAIPIIMGPKEDECAKILPPNSFLHVDNFNGPKYLAEYITFLSENNELLLEFHRWRNDFKIVNEHGYFGTKSFHYCRVCEALNYNDERERVYDEKDLQSFLDEKKLCF